MDIIKLDKLAHDYGTLNHEIQNELESYNMPS